MFLWRACHNLLPTKANLCKRRVINSPKCPICQLEEESVEHIIWSCPSASDVWSCGPKKLQKNKCGVPNFVQLFEELIGRCELHELELFAVVARNIWLRCNTFVHEGEFFSPTQVFMNASVDLEYFQRINAHSEEPDSEIRQSQLVKWQAPPVNVIKVNWDAAIDRRNTSVGLGLLARDAEGKFLVACGIQKRIVVDPIVAEALAALHAVIFAKELGFSSCIFEGDALTIVKAVNSNGVCDSSYGHFMEDVQRHMNDFILSSFVHVMRESNSAAHSLAKEACTHVIDKCWWHCIPPCIGGIIREEEVSLHS